mmetsp:Transcript_29579/g.54953  ORF Transcript_29579/g.54953 Transcript_29579/m.54953 type:complete len:217 (-) Transcript_29579:329-979(-)
MAKKEVWTYSAVLEDREKPKLIAHNAYHTILLHHPTASVIVELNKGHSCLNLQSLNRPPEYGRLLHQILTHVIPLRSLTVADKYKARSLDPSTDVPLVSKYCMVTEVSLSHVEVTVGQRWHGPSRSRCKGAVGLLPGGTSQHSLGGTCRFYDNKRIGTSKSEIRKCAHHWLPRKASLDNRQFTILNHCMRRRPEVKVRVKFSIFIHQEDLDKSKET